MPDATTVNYGWTKPTNNQDDDTWGTLLNADLDGIDSTVFAVSGVANAALPKAGGTLTGAISGVSASFSGAVSATGGFTGTLTGNVTGNVSGSSGSCTGNAATSSACSGNAATASAWQTARTLSFTGDATGSGSVNGSANVATALTLAAVNSNVGAFGSSAAVPVITVNAKGLVTAVTTAPLSGYAPLASPALTGSPTAPTVGTASDASTLIATTSFVQAAIGAAITDDLASTGHVKIGAFVLNWGTYSLGASGGATQNVTFDLAFPTAYIAGWCGVDSAAQQMIGVTGGTGTTTGMQVAKGVGDTSARTGPWFAIGY